MKVTEKKIDDLNLEVTVLVEKDDYASAEKKRLNETRRNAEFKGFRKGMVPASLIQRVYGGQILADAVNEVVSEALDGHIKDNGLHILGEPISSANQPELTWESGNDFTFIFDLGLSPKIDFEVAKEDTVPYYTITATAEDKEGMKKNILMQHGGLQDVEAAGDESYVYVDLKQEGREVKDTFVSMRDLSSAYKTKFKKAKVGSKLKFNVVDALADEGDRARLLHVKKEELKDVNPEFQSVVKSFKDYVAAPATQETFDKIYGEGVVKTEEEFEAQVAKELEKNYHQEAEYRLTKDIRKFYMDKANLTLPEEFLKRWLLAVNRGKLTVDQIATEFPSFVEDFKWQLVRGYILKKFDVKITQEEIEEAAESFVYYQYAMYGMQGMPEDMVKDAARRMLDDDQQLQRFQEQVEDRKAFEAVRPLMTLKKKKISLEKFRELK
ncbi:MAG: hypothetical protein J6W83_02570 [Bacteroidales bacterium]|nr:hypothetical protein [Bacteroidales bacterium]